MRVKHSYMLVVRGVAAVGRDLAACIRRIDYLLLRASIQPPSPLLTIARHTSSFANMVEQTRNIVPLYAARLEHLTWHPTVTVRCGCGHMADVTVEVLWRRLPIWLPISDLHQRLRCEACDERGRVEVDARKALGYDDVAKLP